MATKLLLSILLEPLSAFLRGFWLDAGQSSPDEPWYATAVSIYIGFVKVPVLWRLHMVLRIVKLICFIGTLSVTKPHSATALSRWYAANCVVAAFNLYYCFRMNRLRPQFEGLRARIETVDARYEPTIDRSRGEIGGSLSLNEINASVPNGPLAEAFRGQQCQLHGSGLPEEETAHDPGEGPSQLSIPPIEGVNEESHADIPRLEGVGDIPSKAPNCLNFGNNPDADERVDKLIFPSRLSSKKWTDASVWVTYWLLALLSILVIILDALASPESDGLNPGFVSFTNLTFQFPY
ncbi:hypothetical protein N431DRAFT_451819 [Stipitochalara longipes BDJ]|nr:hypothetical protein N431DRAFT_451819 [Stipitochalara longipes BDJ]